MPTYSQYVTNIPDNLTIFTQSGKLTSPQAELKSTLYTGNDFDVSGPSASNDHTIQIPASDIEKSVYLEILITCSVYAYSKSATAGEVSLGIERQETGSGSGFTDILPFSIVHRELDTTNDGSSTSIKTISVIVATTSGERNNGIDIKISTSSSSEGSVTSSLTNIQTRFRIIN